MDVVVGSFVSGIAEAALDVREQFTKWIYLLAFASALEPQVHENVLQYLVLLIECVDLVADSALKLAIRNAFARNFRKTS